MEFIKRPNLVIPREKILFAFCYIEIRIPPKLAHLVLLLSTITKKLFRTRYNSYTFYDFLIKNFYGSKVKTNEMIAQ